MTHREYQKCADYYDRQNSGKLKPHAPPPKRAETDDKLFYPEVKPLSQAEMMKVIWAGRLGIKEKVV